MDGHVMIWKHFLHHCPFMRGIRRWSADSDAMGQQCAPLLVYLLLAWTACWTSSWVADFRRFNFNVTSLYYTGSASLMPISFLVPGTMKPKKKGRKTKSRSGDGATSGGSAFPPYKQPCLHRGLPSDLGRRPPHKKQHTSAEIGAAASSTFANMDHGASNDISEDDSSLFGSLPRCVPQSSVGLNEVSFGLRNRVWGISQVTEPREGHFSRLFGRGADPVTRPSQFRPLLQPPTNNDRHHERSTLDWGVTDTAHTPHFDSESNRPLRGSKTADSGTCSSRRFSVPQDSTSLASRDNIDNLVQPYRLPSFGRISSDGFLHINSADMFSRSCDNSGSGDSTDSLPYTGIKDNLPENTHSAARRPGTQDDNTFFNVYSITHNTNISYDADAASSSSVSDAAAIDHVADDAASSSGSIEPAANANRTDAVSISGISTGFRTNPSQALFGGFLVAPFQWVEKFYCDSDEESVDELDATSPSDDNLCRLVNASDDTNGTEGINGLSFTDKETGGDTQNGCEGTAASKVFSPLHMNAVEDPPMFTERNALSDTKVECSDQEQSDVDSLTAFSRDSPVCGVTDKEQLPSINDNDCHGSMLNKRDNSPAVHSQNFPYFGGCEASAESHENNFVLHKHENQGADNSHSTETQQKGNWTMDFGRLSADESDNESLPDTSIPAIFRGLFDGPLDHATHGYHSSENQRPACVCGQNCELHNHYESDNEAEVAQATCDTNVVSISDPDPHDSDNKEASNQNYLTNEAISVSPNWHNICGPVNSLRELIRSNPGTKGCLSTSGIQATYSGPDNVSADIHGVRRPRSMDIDDYGGSDDPAPSAHMGERSTPAIDSTIDFSKLIESSRMLPAFISASVLGGDQFPGYDDSSIGAPSLLGNDAAHGGDSLGVVLGTDHSNGNIALENIQEMSSTCSSDIGGNCDPVADVHNGLLVDSLDRQHSTTTSNNASAFPSLERRCQLERARSLENVTSGRNTLSVSNSNSLERARSAEDIGSNFSTLSSLASGAGLGRALGRNSIHRHEEGPVFRPLPDANHLLASAPDVDPQDTGVDAEEDWRQNWYFYQYDHRLLPASNLANSTVQNPFGRRRVSSSILSPPTYEEALNDNRPAATSSATKIDLPEIPSEPPPPYSKAPPPYSEMDEQISASVANSVADSDSVAEGSVHDSDSLADASDTNDVVAHIQRVLAPNRGQRANLIRGRFSQPIYLPDMNSNTILNPLHDNTDVVDSDNSSDDCPTLSSLFSNHNDETSQMQTSNNAIEAVASRPSVPLTESDASSDVMDVEQETSDDVISPQNDRPVTEHTTDFDFSRPVRHLGHLNTALFGHRPPLRWNRNHCLDRWDSWAFWGIRGYLSRPSLWWINFKKSSYMFACPAVCNTEKA